MEKQFSVNRGASKQIPINFLVIAIEFSWFASVAFGYPMIVGIQTDQLLNAPVIVIGHINSINKTGNSAINDNVRGHGDIAADVLEIDVAVIDLIKGKAGTSLRVGGLLVPSDTINYGYLCRNQIPHPASKRRNVFFYHWVKKHPNIFQLILWNLL